MKDALYQDYHDNEWGKPVKEDYKMFEFLILETFQAGLSWYTILSKRENFRKAFDGFDFEKIAQYQEDKIEELMQNAGIIRNKLKIKAVISNAKAYIEIRKNHLSFCDYLWGFVNHQPIINHWKTLSEVPATTDLSDLVSKELKKNGFKFVGSTVIYAHLQATGIVNDHLVNCFTRN